MAPTIIAVIFTLILLGMALRANRRFHDQPSLPMQWWLTGAVTWSAPRPLALAFMPALAAGVFAIVAIIDVTHGPRAGQEGLVIPTFVGLGLTFVAIQLLHFWLIARTLRRTGG